MCSNPVLSGPAIVYDHIGNLEKFKALPSNLPQATMALSESALCMFNEIQRTQLDSTHTVKKYGSAALAFGASIGCATGAVWYVMPRTALGWGKIVVPLVLGTSASHLVQRTCNFSLVSKINTIGKVALSLGINFIKERTYGHYVNLEKERRFKHQDLHKSIFNNLKDTFDGMSRALKNEYIEAESSPAALYELKTSCKNLTHTISIAKKGMQEVGLSDEDILNITKKFQKTAEKIQNHVFCLSDDPAHNLEILLNVPEASTTSLCIGEQALEQISQAQKNIRNYTHELQKWSATALASVVIGAVPYVAAACSTDSVVTKIIAGAASLGLGAITSKCALNYFTTIHTQMDQQVEKNVRSALESTCSIYNDLAIHITKLGLKKRKRTQIVQIAHALKEKIPHLQKQMDLQSIDSGTVTKNLANALDTILLPQVTKEPSVQRKSSRLRK